MEHRVVSSTEWVSARKALLEKEKELTRARDELAKARRELPWERVDERYLFDGPNGEETLADSFAERSQLIVYHFMFDPEWDAGCKSCSFWADNFERNVLHIAHRDSTLVAVSRAPLAKLNAYKQRLGWSFKWVSSGRSDFNFDYGVSFDPSRQSEIAPTYNYRPKSSAATELPGISVFYRDPSSAIFHTYSTYGRGVEIVNAAYHFLDLLPKGRDEDDLPQPMSWLRRRDEYDTE